MKTLISYLMIASFVITTQAAVPAKKSQVPRVGRQNLRTPGANQYKSGSTYGIKKNSLRWASRAGVIDELGGSAETEAAVEKALDWLTKNQKDDGHWEETSSKVAHTGLAILCYLSYGVVPTDDSVKPTEEMPEMKIHAEALSKGLNWLKDQVSESGDMRDGGRMYDQSIGTLALGEAYGITGNEKLRLPLERATSLLIEAQNPKTGGWRYQPHSTTTDLSVSGWVIMALRSAEMARVILRNNTIGKSEEFLDSVGAGKHKGKYGYKSPVPTDTMTAVGMYCQQLFGAKPNSYRQIESAAHINLHLPDEKQENYYYWYYGMLATFLHGGEVWYEWNEKMKPIFLEKQNEDGSWKAEGRRAKKEGTHITTCWAALSLTVYYRYLPMMNGYRRMNRGK